jgi:alpha-beta hydrolase superfamily lysophospholipase
MKDHHERYEEFEKYLVKHGYDVYLFDQRGHGSDKNWYDLGHFADEGGADRVIADTLEVIKYVKAHNRAEKLILFGHSMGSLIARNVVAYTRSIDACILMGTSHPPKFMLFFARLIAACFRKFRGPRTKTIAMYNMVLGGKHYTALNQRTSVDWLTREQERIGTYINDPFCKFSCTTAFYCDLLQLTADAVSDKLISHSDKNMPILIMSGTDDPVGNNGTDITKFYNLLHKMGFQNVDCSLYKNCRHELLNETNRVAVMSEIVEWLNSVVM